MVWGMGLLWEGIWVRSPGMMSEGLGVPVKPALAGTEDRWRGRRRVLRSGSPSGLDDVARPFGGG